LLDSWGGIIVPLGGCWVPGPCDGGYNAFFHFHHLFLYTVLKERHVVDEVFSGSRTIKEVF